MRGPPEPMLAAAVDAVPAGADLQFEPKWDGFRALGCRDRAGVRLTSRRGRDLTRYFPDIARAVGDQLAGPVMVDGELVIWSGHRLDFAALQERLVAGRRLPRMVGERPASYVLFDLLVVDDEDLMGSPLRERRARLEATLAGIRPPLQLGPATTDRTLALRWFDEWAGAGVEGLVVKALGDIYRPGARRWIKVRRRRTVEAVVGAVDGPCRAPTRLVLGAHDAQDVLRIIGATGALAPRDAEALGRLLRPTPAGHPWPSELPSSLMGGLAGQRPARAVTLVEPTLVVEVAGDTAFEHGRFRHSTRFIRIRADV